MQTQQAVDTNVEENNEYRAGTFIDNLDLPVHRWFRYSAGFSAEWVETILRDLQPLNGQVLLDPFAGSGTALLSADKLRIRSVGVEAHSFVARIAKAKLLWDTPVNRFIDKANTVLQNAARLRKQRNSYPNLILRCFSANALKHLDALKVSWLQHKDDSPESELVWLALTSILRPSSSAGTAQWQYILPNKTKKIITEPLDAFQAQINLMKGDMELLQQHHASSLSSVVKGDARSCPEVGASSVDVVITSPPYANNYDYADATRFEMSFWGEVQSWGDLHAAVRKDLIVSSAQHASLEKLVLDRLLTADVVKPIRAELEGVCRGLAEERLRHGGKKHYHTMIAAYFIGMARMWIELRRVCKPDAQIYFVIGDSAPYGIHVPVDRWLGELAIAAGFHGYTFQKWRDRNMKWKNRKHRVLLHEGLLKVGTN